MNFKFGAKTFFVFVFVFTGCSGFSDSDQKSDSSDFRNVFYEDLLPRIDQFSETGVSHFSEILFDFARYQVTNSGLQLPSSLCATIVYKNRPL